MDRAAAERIATQGGWLAHQPAAFRTALLAAARLEAFEVGSYTFHVGDALGGIYGLVAGGFAVHVATRAAGPDLATILRPPVWFGQGPLMTRRPRVLSFRATEPSFAFHVPLAALEAVSRALPEAARALGAMSVFGMDVAIHTVSDLLIREPDRRIAATLLRVTAAPDGLRADDQAGFRLTQAELGEMANASRHLVNRTLGAFAARGWVKVGYGRIAVRDAVALAGFVGPRE
ncbi:Crp/Fnr family transcriptional regulator [Roseomonas sp. AR75]|uniref:Crp/Fnr family transcriptional regulator n=1 Tax=Roseomonas sp. AR75 TaxID=2562311 RepID=UPI001485324F|nr:Crp/Fnr family transcriptional regulator [Roseomonas sp. AR75]